MNVFIRFASSSCIFTVESVGFWKRPVSNFCFALRRASLFVTKCEQMQGLLALWGGNKNHVNIGLVICTIMLIIIISIIMSHPRDYQSVGADSDIMVVLGRKSDTATA